MTNTNHIDHIANIRALAEERIRKLEEGRYLRTTMVIDLRGKFTMACLSACGVILAQGDDGEWTASHNLTPESVKYVFTHCVPG